MKTEIYDIFAKKVDVSLAVKNIGCVVLYGAGQMGADASLCLLNSNINVCFFADKNHKVIGQEINGILVKHPEDFSEEEKENCLFAISVITVSYNTIYNYLKDLGCKNICFVGDLVNETCSDISISQTWSLNNPSEEELVKINNVLDKYSDMDSKKSLIQFLEWSANRIELDDYAPVLKIDEKYFIPQVLNSLGSDNRVVSYDFLSHDPVEELKINKIDFQELHIIEPCKAKYKDLKSNNVFVHNFGLGNENKKKSFINAKGLTVKSRFVEMKTDFNYPIRKLDDIITDSYSFIKIYGLGLAFDVVKGSINTIKKFRPVVAVTIHHTREDFVEIPNLLMDNLDNYDFYLRLHSYCGFETLFYAIPKEKVR